MVGDEGRSRGVEEAAHAPKRGSRPNVDPGGRHIVAIPGRARDPEITRERALELARLVLREDALKLYKLKSPGGSPAASGR
jgi:hypothetical protein